MIEMKKTGTPEKTQTVALLVTIVLLLSACSGSKVTYPHLEYRNSSWNFDVLNKTILLESDYVLDDGHAYDVVETGDGYDLVLHFIKGDVQKP